MIEILRLTDGLKSQWDTFVEESNNGTIFNRLDFLSYHQNRFKDAEHHLVWFEDGAVIAVMPLAILAENAKRVAKSPYGGSYGGIIVKKDLSLEKAEEIVTVLLHYLKTIDVNMLNIIFSPLIYHSHPTNYLDFFLLKKGAEISNSDLTSYIPITDTEFKQSSAKAVRKALKSGVTVLQNSDVETFYEILVQNRQKFNATPVHSLDEISWLINNMPDNIFLFIAYLGNVPIAGTLIFQCNKRVILDFYWAHLDEYQEYRPINLLVSEVIKWASARNIKYFDFGTQTFNMNPNYGGSRFKETFGATGIFRTTYSLNLTNGVR